MLDVQSRPAFLVSLTAFAVAAIGIGTTVPPVVRAAFGPAARASELDEELDRQVLAHDEAQAEYASRFNGRSVFYMPKIAPPRPVGTTPPPPTRTEPKETEPIVVKPRQYAGPGIKAFDGDKVWFADGKLLGVGEEADGLKVLEVNAPWSAKVSHLGWEGDVQIFPTFDPSRVFRSALSTRTPGIRESDAPPTAPNASRATAAPPASRTPPKRDPEIPDE